jgi:hypothetical protein
VTLDPNEVHWHVRPGPQLVRVRPGRDGLYRSKVFPGLWLDPVALLNQDIAGVLAVLERGVATPEHEAAWPGPRPEPSAANEPETRNAPILEATS